MLHTHCHDSGIALVLAKDHIIYYFLFGEILLWYMDHRKIIGIDTRAWMGLFEAGHFLVIH